jgi:acyl-CoA thioesterase-1
MRLTLPRHVLALCALLLGLAMPLAHAQAPKPAAAKPAAAVPNTQRVVLFLGDSLSAAYNLPTAQGWVALTEQQMRKSHPSWRVVNASVSGETTAGGASRIDRELKRHRPAIVVIELGGNDGLRGLPLSQTRANLDKMIAAAKAAQARVLLIGMRLPPNYGQEYTEAFANNYRDLAQKHRVALVPFLLEPIAFDEKAFQADRIHPTAEAQPKLRDHVWPWLERLLK